MRTTALALVLIVTLAIVGTSLGLYVLADKVSTEKLDRGFRLTEGNVAINAKLTMPCGEIDCPGMPT